MIGDRFREDLCLDAAAAIEQRLGDPDPNRRRPIALCGPVSSDRVKHPLNVVVLFEFVDQFQRFGRLILGQMRRRDADVFVLR